MSHSTQSANVCNPPAVARADALTALSTEPALLPPELKARTEVLADTLDAWGEKLLEALRLRGWARRIRALRRSWALFRRSRYHAAVITRGDFEGGILAALQWFRGSKRPVHLMFDCLWYGGGWLRRAWARFCLRQVDCCVVWASVERQRYAAAYGISQEKFVYVPHHDTLHARYRFEIGDRGYIFTGGNADRDYGQFFDAVRKLDVPCILATNERRLLAGLNVPANVRIVGVTPAEFRQLMAESHIVVVPMLAGLLHAGGQQTALNAMKMGKPVVLTDVEGGRDYIEHLRTGVLVPGGDTAALRAAIERLLADPGLAREIGSRARSAAAWFTTERCNGTIWNHALRLAERRSAGSSGPKAPAGDSAPRRFPAYDGPAEVRPTARTCAP